MAATFDDNRRHNKHRSTTAATFYLLAAYAIFGVLHELSHLIVAAWLLPGAADIHDDGDDGSSSSSLKLAARVVVRAVLGRYSLVRVPAPSLANDDEYYGEGGGGGGEAAAATTTTKAIIRHAGWAFSVLLAALCHRLHVLAVQSHGNRKEEEEEEEADREEEGKGGSSSSSFSFFPRLLLGDSGILLRHLFLDSTLPLAAYVTALEAISTDLFGFVPYYCVLDPSTTTTRYFACFCGNFGILLLNPAWMSVDGGRTALDVLEKMVNVTMMRGAQSGGVVTFEPDRRHRLRRPCSPKGKDESHSSSSLATTIPPPLRGVRSRVVNAKRTDLSERVRAKVVSDNRSSRFGCLGDDLRGCHDDDAYYYANNAYGHGHGHGHGLVKGFFGHTRFATSSKATLDGTHPHRWCDGRVYEMYSFGSPSSSSMSAASSTAANSAPPARCCGPRRRSGVVVENYVTHNGDFEFYTVNGKHYDVEVVQRWLESVLGAPMPAAVDSAAIAGVIDLLRTQGSFALSLRYALCLTLPSSAVEADPSVPYPTMREYEEIAKTFEEALDDLLLLHHQDADRERKGRTGTTAKTRRAKTSLEDISSSAEKRALLASAVESSIRERATIVGVVSSKRTSSATGATSATLSSPSSSSALATLAKFVTLDDDDPEEHDAERSALVRATVDAFFDNDLLHSTRLFLRDAKGSFGLAVASSVDAHRQVCFAARGQTLSVGFYPRRGIVCYGSEQAAVKAGLNYEVPGGGGGGDRETTSSSSSVDDSGGEDDNAVRLDLDDLGGEICLLDWGYGGDAEPAVSPPNRNLKVDRLMNGRISVVLLHQGRTSASYSAAPLSRRLTLLEGNEFVRPLLDDCADPVLADIRDIPRVCRGIQDDWRDVGLNRMTAWNLANCVRERMRAIVDGEVKPHGGQVDVLVTGCEVSLWLAEQFVSDLQKCFPRLFVRAVSSNKILGLFGQELAMPATGFPISQTSMDIKDPIVIIVSHSGGTFGPLACSNLLQSFSSSIFAVTSEWDTQIGKQLRGMHSDDDLLSSRIFSTEVGVRPAEPCSVSVAATHQLLTNIFEHICVTIIGDPHFSKASGAIVTERDLQVLERCNRDNIKALEEIVGVDSKGDDVHEKRSKTERELRSAGDLWAEHVLENAKAYIMTFVYVIVTVTSGFPLVSGLAKAFGLTGSEGAFYIIRFLDALIYFWLPQINVIILRLFQRRNLRHRMVGRTVVVGDIPWVAQAAEAFLSKIFACSYSIAGLNVLSGNPADHLVHRHTHRVVRGSLLVCGRPDGRLPALTSLEASTCLSVNQASSIQSLGGTCESITIGHNKSKLPLSHRAIYLKSHRPLFLSEKVLDNIDAHEDLVRQRKEKLKEEEGKRKITFARTASYIIENIGRRGDTGFLELSMSRSRQAKTTRSSASLLGAYVNLERDARRKRTQCKDLQQAEHGIINSMIKERQGIENARRFFHGIDIDDDNVISLEEFIAAYQKTDAGISREHLTSLFEEADIDDNGTLSFDEFLKVARMPNLLAELSIKNRDSRGLVQVQASNEQYFGEELRKHSQLGVNSMAMSQSQHFSMELYESRIASLQRFVAMTVMFHQMGMRVQTFFPKISFGLLGYRMDRTHSIMRIATTASPVSGADVRERMEKLRLVLKIERSVHLIARTWKKWKLEENGAH